MSSHSAKEAEARNDSIVEVDELCSGKFVDVDLHRSSWPGAKGNALSSCRTLAFSGEHRTEQSEGGIRPLERPCWAAPSHCIPEGCETTLMSLVQLSDGARPREIGWFGITLINEIH